MNYDIRKPGFWGWRQYFPDGTDSFDEGAKMPLLEYYNWQRSPKMVFHFPMEAISPTPSPNATPTSLVVFDLPDTVPVLNFQLHIMLF